MDAKSIGISDGCKAVAYRMHNAEENFISVVIDRGFTRSEAIKVLAVYRKLKVVKMDAVSGVISVNHGALLDAAVLHRAISGK